MPPATQSIYNHPVKTLCAVAFLLLLAPLSARADEPVSASAKEHYQKGTAAYALGNYDEAAREYEAAFQKRQLPELLYNAAQAHRLAGNKKRALLLYENYLRLFGAKIVNRDEVSRLIAQLKTALAADESAATSPPTNAKVVEPPVAKPEPQPTLVVAVTKPPPKKKTPAWVWGVVGAGAAIVVGGVVVGVVLGTRPHDPAASLGAVRGN